MHPVVMGQGGIAGAHLAGEAEAAVLIEVPQAAAEAARRTGGQSLPATLLLGIRLNGEGIGRSAVMLQQGLEVRILQRIAFADPVQPVEIRRGDGLGTTAQVAGQHQHLIIHRQGLGPALQGTLQGQGYRPAKQLQQHEQFHQLPPLLRIRQGGGHLLGLGRLEAFKINGNTEQPLEQSGE